MDDLDAVCSTRPQRVSTVIFPASDVIELVEIVLCKQQVTGSRPVRSIRNDTTVGLAPAVVFRFGVHGFRPHPDHAPRNPMPPSDGPLGLIP